MVVLKPGVIYIPVKQELYFADIELGAYKIKDITDIEAYPSLDTLMEKPNVCRMPTGQTIHLSS